VLVADTTGAVSLFDASRPDETLRRWRPPVLPAGPPSHGFVALEKFAVFVAAGRQIVALDAAADGPAWIIDRPATEPEILGITVAGGVLYATDLFGTVTAYDASGKPLGVQRPASRDYLPRAAATALADGTLHMPTIDGSIVVLPPIVMKK
jgi:hypothetical protein